MRKSPFSKPIALLAALAATLGITSMADITGDVNGDGSVNASDISAVASIISGESTTDYEGREDVNGDGSVNASDISAIASIIAGETTDEEPRDIAFDYTALTEATETVPTDTNDVTHDDFIENSEFTKTITITWDGESATVDGSVSKVSVSTDGGHVTVTSTAKKVAYVLKGTTTNGSIKFYSEKKFSVTLDGVTITNPTGAAINNQCGKSFFLVLTDGTTSTLTDGETYTMVDGEDQKGTLFSEGQILISGSGTLNVNSVGKNGIVSDDYVFVRPGSQINVTSTSGHCIKANDGVRINGSVLNLGTSADGAKGINCEDFVAINGGRTTIIATGTTDTSDTTSVAGVKCDSTITIAGGTLLVKVTGDDAKAIKTRNLVMTGGELAAVALGSKNLAAPKGIKSDGDITVSGGSFYSYSANSDPVDADGSFTVADGYSTYTTTDHSVTISY